MISALRRDHFTSDFSLNGVTSFECHSDRNELISSAAFSGRSQNIL